MPKDTNNFLNPGVSVIGVTRLGFSAKLLADWTIDRTALKTAAGSIDA